MSDWPTVAIATGPALVAGVVGYAGARLQLRGTVRQAEVELERLQEQHHEEHLRHRQGTYHDLLDAIREVHTMPTEPAAVQAWADGWAPRYSHHLNAVSLFGTQQAREQAVAFNGLMLEIADAVESDLGSEEWSAEWQRRIDDVSAAFNALVNAMRADVAPTSARDKS